MQQIELHSFTENDPAIRGLNQANNVLIVQQPDWIECYFPCCDLANEYQIFNTDPTFEQKFEQIGIVKEQNNIICQLLFRQFRSFEADVILGTSTSAKMKRFCRLPFPFLAKIDLCKQESEVNRLNGSKIGSAEWPCWCQGCCCFRGSCSCQELDIKDSNGNVIYSISSSCCQAGYLCWPLGCCGPCSKRHYPITDASGNVVGEITNECSGIVNEFYTRADNFGIQFPPGCSFEIKLLLIQTAVFLDYLQYNG